MKFFNWVESPHEHSHFQPVVDNTINAFHCLIESNHKDHPDLQSQTRHHPKSNPNPFSILLFTKIYNPNPSRSLSFSACPTTLTPPTSSQFSQWKAWGRLLFFAHFWIVTIICEERSKGLMALVRMVRRPWVLVHCGKATTRRREGEWVIQNKEEREKATTEKDRKTKKEKGENEKKRVDILMGVSWTF